MKPPSRGLGRPLRCLILLATAGAVLAADNSWLTKLRFDFDAPVGWLSNFYSAKMPSPDPAALPVEHVTTATLSMDRLVNGRLFSQPASGWQLDSARTDAPLAWMTRDSSSAAAPGRAQYFSTPILSSGVVASRSFDSGRVPTEPDGGPGIPGQTGNWISNASGNWGTAANWQAGTIPFGPSSKAHFDTLDITVNVTVTVETSRTVGEVYVGDTNGTNPYTIAPNGGTSLTFDNSGAASVLTQSATSAGDTISVPLLLQNDLNINNLSTAHDFVITGDIASSAATGTLQNLVFNSNIVAPGAISVAGNITNGATGATVQVEIDGGFVNFSGTNTYSGATFVAGGTLSVKGDNSGATGTVFVSGSGSFLVGKGTVGGNVYTFGGTITGGLIGDVGKLTLTQNLVLSTGEGGGTYWADLSGDTSDLLAITGNLRLGEGSTLDIHGSADGFTTYVLATFATRTDVFDTVTGIPGGYTLVYNADDIELVPTAIPEPATWIGGALALCAVACAQPRRLRSYWLSVIS